MALAQRAGSLFRNRSALRLGHLAPKRVHRDGHNGNALRFSATGFQPPRVAKAIRSPIPDGQDGVGLHSYLSRQGRRRIVGREKHLTLFGTTYVFLRLPSSRERDHTLGRFAAWTSAITFLNLLYLGGGSREWGGWPAVMGVVVANAAVAWLAWQYDRWDRRGKPVRLTNARMLAGVAAGAALAPMLSLVIYGVCMIAVKLTVPLGLFAGIPAMLVLCLTGIIIAVAITVMALEHLGRAVGWRLTEAIVVLAPEVVILGLAALLALKL